MSREISVYSGTVRIGRLCVRRRDKDGASRVEAFTSDDVSLGVYQTVKAAAAAVSERAER